MIKIKSAKRIAGEIHVPGDKSISHRALILAALAEGKSQLTGLATGADVCSTRRILEQLGTPMQIQRESVQVEGLGKFGLKEPSQILHCGNSGTSARLLSGVLSGQNFFSVLTGDASLCRRPMARVVAPLQQMGAKISGRQNNTRLPLAIQGGKLTGIDYQLPIASAQVKTAILLAGILAAGETTVTEPAPSRDHSERLLRWLGLPLQQNGLICRISPATIPGFSLQVPGDFSSAAFFLALGVLHPNSELTLRGVNLNETRTGFLRFLQQMGAICQITLTSRAPEPVGDITIQPAALQNCRLEPKQVPAMIDELPLLAVVATQAKGTLLVTGAQELRVKESDRIHGIVTQLQRLGAHITELPDGFQVEGPTQLHGATVKSLGDHRIAMALAIAAKLAMGETTLTGEQWVNISFPEFFQLLSQIEGS